MLRPSVPSVSREGAADEKESLRSSRPQWRVERAMIAWRIAEEGNEGCVGGRVRRQVRKWVCDEGSEWVLSVDVEKRRRDRPKTDLVEHLRDRRYLDEEDVDKVEEQRWRWEVARVAGEDERIERVVGRKEARLRALAVEAGSVEGERGEDFRYGGDVDSRRERRDG